MEELSLDEESHHHLLNEKLFTLAEISDDENETTPPEEEVSAAFIHSPNQTTISPMMADSPSTTPSSLTPCVKCQKTEESVELRVAQVKAQLETEITRMKKEVESATKTKESVVMKYATGEMELLKLKKSIENSDKLIKQFNNDIEIANRKHKMLSSERERLSLMIDAKVHDIEDLQKEINRLHQDIQSRDFKFTWTQNKLREESEAHNATRQTLEAKIAEIENELKVLKESTSSSVSNGELTSNCEYKKDAGDDTETCEIVTINGQESSNSKLTSSPSGAESVIDSLREKNAQLLEENKSLSCSIAILEQERLQVEASMGRLQESNSEHLHQIAVLQSDLAATECLKVQLQKEKELVKVLENECEGLRQAHVDVLNDMSVCRSKEAELLAYTQQVTEKNVALQSKLSSIEAKSDVLKDENERLRQHGDKLEGDIRDLQQIMTNESKYQLEEKQMIENDVNTSKVIITQLQQQLDEARGEIGLLNRKLNSSVRELSKELSVVRKQVKDGHPGSDGLSQSSRTSSSSSLTNGDCSSQEKLKQEDTTACNGSTSDQDQECPVIPDQQVLIERIVKLQRMLAKKQDKLEFLQEHVKQLVESLQKKSKIIQGYAMSQDIDALSSNLAEKNRLALDSIYAAEVLKHKGIMASVYGSKPADDAMTLDLSLEINRKLQVVLEDTLLRNITLKDSLNTLGKEISKLTDSNNELHNQVLQLAK
ncbi:coiled-coil domain-containing protein 186 isoform X1 [Folsomia candida]|uniref:coiled-coil domain-containing protein 186 isoform X1 n=1 Tax=Folsomia candida TaxID=158441 RepID=UPI001604EA05|nr:coiled-coil domain-containing protein 186 isoform X1 [Folsomia candida]